VTDETRACRPVDAEMASGSDRIPVWRRPVEAASARSSVSSLDFGPNCRVFAVKNNHDLDPWRDLGGPHQETGRLNFLGESFRAIPQGYN
jgi:hypothetical protein